MSRGLVLGCGGPVGFAWTVGALIVAERELGWDARSADMIVGTSAGAELAAFLGSGIAAAELADGLLGDPALPVVAEHLTAGPGLLPPWPRPRPTSMRLAARGLARDTAALTALAGALPAGRGDASWLARLADRLVPAGGWVEHPATWLVAADLSTGARIAFGSPGAPRISLGDALRASWAVPGWFPPVVTGGLRLADGGIVSTASADLLLPRPPREVLVFAPMASAQPGRRTGLGRIEQQLRRVMTRGLDAEVDALRAAGSRVIRVEPGPEDLAAMGAYLMDRRRRRRVLDTSLRTSTATLRQIVAASNDGTDEGALA